MLQYDFMRNALSAGFLIAMLCPVVGSFLVLKRFSMMGDTLSHSAFAGVTIGFLLGLNPSVTSLIYRPYDNFHPSFHNPTLRPWQ